VVSRIGSVCTPVFSLIILIIFLTGYKNNPGIPRIIIPLLVFLLIYAVSGFFIIEKIRYFLFAYQFVQYASAIIMFFVIIKVFVSEKYFLTIVWVIFALLFTAALVGAAAILFRFNIIFDTPFANIIPEAFKESEFLRATFNKAVLNTHAYIFSINYPRALSLFMHGNTYGQALIVAAPLTLFLIYRTNLMEHTRKRILFKIMLWAGIFLMALNFLFTADRSGLIGIVIGFIWWVLFWEKWQLKSKKNLYITIIVAAIFTIAVLVIFILYYEELLTARPGSLQSRMMIYQYTIESWKDKPFFGWGVTRELGDVFPAVEAEDLFFSLGTHSTYMGILYKQGVLGLGLF